MINYEIQLENSHIPVVCEQVLFETFPMEDQQAEGILVKPATIKKSNSSWLKKISTTDTARAWELISLLTFHHVLKITDTI